jgi:hypothetical protein
VPNAVAFFPWVTGDVPITIGPLRLLPYRRGKLPGDMVHVTQVDIDGVLSAYANRPRVEIKKATILEFDKWQTGMDVLDVVPALFRARNIIAFAALSCRQLFRQHLGYCNYDTYSLVVQGYKPGDAGTFSFSTRRRDGGTNQLWSSNMFAFHRPNHVEMTARMELDQSLLAALLAMQELPSSLLEALIEFNCANTDSPDVPEHVEIVMVKSSFEWLFEINDKVDSFVSALNNVLRDLECFDQLDGPLKAQWKKKLPKAARPLEAWAREFCDVRGAAAHGKPKTAARFIWSPRMHLAFASILFPLLFKKVLATKGFMKLDDFDVERLKRIDAYVLHSPFDFDWSVPDATHPWVEIDCQAFVCSKIRLVDSEKIP